MLKLKEIKKIIVFLSVSVFFVISQNVYSQNPATYKIVSISTDGNKFYDSKTIISNSGLKIGQEISIPSDDTRDAINRLWNLNLFSDISITADRKIGTDAYIVIRVKELPKMNVIKYSGNDEFSEKDLNDKIPLAKGQVITPQTIHSRRIPACRG